MVAWFVGSPPPTRGTRCIRYLLSVKGGITPAYAGNTKFIYVPRTRIWDHPRLRGEHICFHFLAVGFQGSPPPTRGTHRKGT